jgi:hypothetical protein
VAPTVPSHIPIYPGPLPDIDAWSCELPARRPPGYALAGEFHFSTGRAPTDLRAPTVHGSVHRMPTVGSKWLETNRNRSDKCAWHLSGNVAAGANLR